MKSVLVLVGLSAMPALVLAANPQETKGGDGLHPRVKMTTSLGDIVLELDAEKTPITVDNFLRYAQDGFYDGTVFHRVKSDFMIQGGGFTSEMDEKKAGLREPILNEWRTGLKNVRGAIAMARKGARPGAAEMERRQAVNSATSQFFINVVDNARLDLPQADGGAYCAFGKVVEGIDVVDRIRNTKVIAHPKYSTQEGAVTPEEPIVISKVELVGDLDRGRLAERVEASKKRIVAYDADPLAYQEELAAEIIRKAEQESGNTVQKAPSGLRYVTLKAGDGPTPQPTDEVEVHYTGWLVYGNKFDSSVDRKEPFTFSLTGGVIKGWLEGVASMKVGEKRKLIIPPKLGYANRGSPPKIPPDSILVFDVELLGIK